MPAWKRLKIVEGLLTYRKRILKTGEPKLEPIRNKLQELAIAEKYRDEEGMIGFPIDVMLAKELTVVATNGMQPARYDVMLNMITAGKLDPMKLITRTIPLEETGPVMAAMDGYATTGFVVIDRY